MGITGMIAIAFGAILFIRPDVGALTLATVFGFFVLVSGITTIVMAVNHRQGVRV